MAVREPLSSNRDFINYYVVVKYGTISLAIVILCMYIHPSWVNGAVLIYGFSRFIYLSINSTADVSVKFLYQRCVELPIVVYVV